MGQVHSQPRRPPDGQGPLARIGVGAVDGDLLGHLLGVDHHRFGVRSEGQQLGLGVGLVGAVGQPDEGNRERSVRARGEHRAPGIAGRGDTGTERGDQGAGAASCARDGDKGGDELAAQEEIVGQHQYAIAGNI